MRPKDPPPRAAVAPRAPASGEKERSSAPPLRVRTLGAFTVWRGHEAIPAARWSRPTVVSLFKLLLSTPGHRLLREQAVELLWPEAGPERAATNLRVTLHRLRAILDTPGIAHGYVRSDGPLLVLDPAGSDTSDPAWLDADAFARAVATALAAEDSATCWAALTLYGGDYLPDDPYEDWAVVRREELRQQYHALLLHMAGLSARDGEPAKAVRLLHSLLAADPCQERAARLLMRLLAADGERAAALRVYDVLARALRDELDLAPTPETATLRARLLAADPESAADPVPMAPTNLPAALTAFIGRGRELAAVEHALARGPAGCRLLTLTGIGGCGKTRLALQVAAGRGPAYPDGVWWVEMAGLAEPTRLPNAIATALGLRETLGHPVPATLADHLRPLRTLLVLDNCEHLIGACAAIVTTLLRACPHLQILATSREAMGVAGETVWPVPPLAVPPPADALFPVSAPSSPSIPPAPLAPARGAHGAALLAAEQRGGEEVGLPWNVGEEAIGHIPLDRLDRLERFEAVQLFLERARASRPDFTLSADNAAAVVRICRRLDGLPLAIELAAARLGALSVHEVAARLDDCFRLLATQSRAMPPRHQTLRGVLDWSYAHLSPPEQALLRRLSVFAGGWTLAAAEAVCAGDGVDASAVLDVLAALVAKSLVLLVEHNGEARYRMLETVRQYAHAQAVASADDGVTRRRQCDWCVRLVEDAAPALRGADQDRWLSRLEGEHDNLRAALAWSKTHDETTADLLRLVIGLSWFWELRGHVGEGRRWLEEALAVSRVDGDVPRGGLPRARALDEAGRLACRQGDVERAAALHREALVLWRAHGNRRGIAASLAGLGAAASHHGDYIHATALLEESVALFEGLGDERGSAMALHDLGFVALLQGSYGRATRLLEQCLPRWRRLEDRWGMAFTYSILGLAAGQAGADERAVALLEEGLAVWDTLRNEWGAGLAFYGLGLVAQRQEAYERAARLYWDALRLHHGLGMRWNVALQLEGMADVAAAIGHTERAARLLGAADALRVTIGAPVPAALRLAHERAVTTVHTSLGDGPFAAAWTRGQAMSPEQAVAYALDNVLPRIAVEGDG